MNEQNQNPEQISPSEKRRLKNKRKRERREAEKQKIQRKKMAKRLVWILVGVGILWAFVFMVSNQKVLPPTTAQGHIERSPESHIVNSPMDNRVHKHMLEHSDGDGPPGIIINYNCIDFDCESNFIDQLISVANEFPDNVYVAPYPNMSSRLVLSALGRQEVLDVFDEERIKKFIKR